MASSSVAVLQIFSDDPYRILRNSYTSGTLTETRHYFYTSEWQSIEERVGTSTNPNRQFVWGQRFLDDLVLRDRDTTGSGTLNERLYAMQDPLGSVVAAVNSSGVVQERYAYAPYGAPAFLTAAFATQSASNVDWETLFAGYRFDGATALYPIRNRFLHCLLAWLTRDPLGGGIRGTALYEYADSQPAVLADSTGLAPALAPPNILRFPWGPNISGMIRFCKWDKSCVFKNCKVKSSWVSQEKIECPKGRVKKKGRKIVSKKLTDVWFCIECYDKTDCKGNCTCDPDLERDAKTKEDKPVCPCNL